MQMMIFNILGDKYLSWPSFVLLFLFLLAIFDLWEDLRAGPILIEVFSKGVVDIETLFPLYEYKFIGIYICVNDIELIWIHINATFEIINGKTW